MAAPDFTGIRDVIESWMTDSAVAITRPWDEPDLDDVTGDLMDQPDATLYAGDGLVLPIGPGDVPDPAVQRIVAETGATYRLLIPVGADVEARAGDHVRVTTAGGPIVDPLVLRRRWAVAGLAAVSTLPVVRILYLRETSLVTAV